MRQHRDGQRLESRSKLRLEVTDHDSETVTMLLLLVVLEFPVAQLLLETVPEGTERATLLLGPDRWELPRKIDPVEVVVIQQTIHGVDELRPAFRSLGLPITSSISITLFQFNFFFLLLQFFSSKLVFLICIF